jgi:hypothetical protein
MCVDCVAGEGVIELEAELLGGWDGGAGATEPYACWGVGAEDVGEG